MEDAGKRIKQLIAKQLKINVDSVRDESLYVDDLGADSLDVVEMIMWLEEEFNITITDEEVDSLTSVQKTIDFVTARSRQ